MIDIFESEISELNKLFWHSIYDELIKQINGEIQILYDDFNDSIIVKVIIDRFNYTVCMTFPRMKEFERYKLLTQILQCVRYNIYKVVFK